MKEVMKNMVMIMALGMITMSGWAQDKVFTVEDFPIKMAIECDELEKAKQITVTSTCDGKVTITKEDTQASGGCVGTIMRKWTMTDECGNTQVVEQYITLLDNTLPVIEDVEDMEIVNLKDVPMPAVSDNCKKDIEVKYNDEFQNVGGKIVSIRTYTAVDDCGNTATKRQTLTMNSPE